MASSTLDSVNAHIAQFLAGDWEALQGFDPEVLARHPHRSQLALADVAQHLGRNDLPGAHRAMQQVITWGGRQPDLMRVLLAGAHLDLAQARLAQRQAATDDTAAQHRAEALSLLQAITHDPAVTTLPVAALAATPAAGAPSDAYREEVLRLRGLVAELRGSVGALRAKADVSVRDAELIQRILAARLTYLSVRKMTRLARTCRAIEEQGIPGLFLEAGCALGGSAILLASAKGEGRALQVYDVFGMIPPPGENDTPDVLARYDEIVAGRSQGIDGDRYYGYEPNLLAVVRHNLSRFGIDAPTQQVTLVQGLVQDTLHPEGPVALAHIDLDWFEPVQVCLERIYPRLSIGGSIILDDYNDWGGCRQAADAFLATVPGTYVADDAAASMKITKLKEPPCH